MLFIIYPLLKQGLRKSGGRNNHGRITSYQKGGGAKRLYRMIDFKRNESVVKAVVQRIEYDPNRSARIALVEYQAASAEHPKATSAYIIAPDGLKARSRSHLHLSRARRPSRGAT